MVTYGGLNFATDIGVLLDLRNLRGHKTVQETYKCLESSDLDAMLDTLRLAYNRAYKSSLDENEFATLLADNKFGLMRLTQVYELIVKEMMFNGLTDEEVAERKKVLMDLMSK